MAGSSVGHRPTFSDGYIFGESPFRFVEDVLQTGEAGERKSIHRNRADLTDGRLFQRRAAVLTKACLVTQHRAAIGHGSL